MADDELKKIEEELAGYIRTDRKNWTRIYQLMHEVETKKLYKGRRDTPSFTSWVNALADELQVHVSLLWARLKAGRIYAEYEERAVKQGRSVPDFAELAVSPDSINLCEKVAGKNAAEMDKLIDRVVEGSLTRDDLRAAAKAKRASGGKMPTTRHDRVNAEDRTEKTSEVTAADIVVALRKSSWLTVARTDKYFDHIYRFYTEFRIPSGSSRSTRRIDVMIAETFTVDEPDVLALRGIEIKIDINDLLGDHKMQEYTDFCDYFYIAIPAGSPELLEAAESVRRPSWGILTVTKDGKVTVAREPERLNPAFRSVTLTNCLIKLK